MWLTLAFKRALLSWVVQFFSVRISTWQCFSWVRAYTWSFFERFVAKYGMRLYTASNKHLILLRGSFRVQFEMPEHADGDAPEIKHSGMVIRMPSACENCFVQLFTSLGHNFFLLSTFWTVRRRWSWNFSLPSSDLTLMQCRKIINITSNAVKH